MDHQHLCAFGSPPSLLLHELSLPHVVRCEFNTSSTLWKSEASTVWKYSVLARKEPILDSCPKKEEGEEWTLRDFSGIIAKPQGSLGSKVSGSQDPHAALLAVTPQHALRGTAAGTQHCGFLGVATSLRQSPSAHGCRAVNARTGGTNVYELPGETQRGHFRPILLAFSSLSPGRAIPL